MLKRGTMDSKKIVEEKIEQMISFAEKQDTIIRYNRVLDILYDKDDSITEETISYVVDRLEQKGIIVIRDSDEDYENAASDVDNFIPARK